MTVGDKSELTFGGLANSLFALPSTRRGAFITARTTGNVALSELEPEASQELLLIEYTDPVQLDELASSEPNEFDVVITDPHHTYESSFHCLEVCLRLLRPGAVMVCHDCVPPPQLISPDFVKGPWCGVTFAAFRDVMASRGAAWSTLDTDFGIGLAIAPVNSNSTLPADRWTRETHGDYVARYTADPFAFMRTVEAARWQEAVSALRTGSDLSYLAASFDSWDRLVPGLLRDRLATTLQHGGD